MFCIALRIALVAGILQLSVTACPDGWQQHGLACYHFSHDREEWTGAYQMCQIMGGHLVEIDDSNENKYLTEQVKNLGRVHWIGLSDVSKEGTWVWMTSRSKITNDNYSNWVPGEPSTFDLNHEPENCVNFYTTGQWNDAHCTQYNYYICETEIECKEFDKATPISTDQCGRSTNCIQQLLLARVKE